jgi:hypothetical protein
MWIRALVFLFFFVNHTLGRRTRIPEHMMMKTSEDDDVWWSNKWISINQAIVVAVWLGVIAWNTCTWFYYTQGKTISLFPLSPAFISCWIWHCDEFQQKRRGTKTRLQITDLTSPTNILIALWRDAAAMACAAVFHAASESWSCHFSASTKASGWNDMRVATVLECRIQVFANQYSGPDGITTLKRIKCRHGVRKQRPRLQGWQQGMGVQKVAVRWKLTHMFIFFYFLFMLSFLNQKASSFIFIIN